MDLTPGTNRLFTSKDEFGVSVPENSPYGTLAAEVDQMSELTGFRRGQLTAHALLGTQPVLEPASVQRRTGFTGRGSARSHTYVTVRLNRPLSERQLRKLSNAVRAAWPERETEPPYGQLVRKIVHEVLGDRAGQDWSDDAWESIAEEYARRTGKAKHPGTLRTQYHRMCEKGDG